MKTLFFRLISALLLLCVLAGTAACSTPSDSDAQTTEPSADTTNTDTTAPSADVDENGYLNDQLPNDLDYGDQVVTMLTWEDVEHEEFFVEEMTGDVVGDAIYKRTLTVEERLGVKLEEITCKANASNINTWVNFISNDNLSGSHAFDIMAGYSQSMASAASQSLCYDLLDADCEYLNFDNPWWSELLIEQATINGKLYFCSGDISINALYMLSQAKSESGCADRIHVLEDRLSKAEQKKKKLLSLLLDAIITREDYQSSAQEMDREIEQIKAELREQRQKERPISELSEQLAKIQASLQIYRDQDEPTTHIYSKILRKMVVYPDNHTEVYLEGIPTPFGVRYFRQGRGAQYVVVCEDC